MRWQIQQPSEGRSKRRPRPFCICRSVTRG